MSALLRSELLKARTTRTAVGLALGLAVIVGGLAGVGAAVVDRPQFAFADHTTRDALTSLGFVPLFALLFGLLSATSEYRHGTISPTLLATPDRVRVVVAKSISSALVGLAVAVFAIVVALVVAIAVLSARGFEIDTGEAARAAVGVLLAAALWGALGAGVGSLVTNQVAAIVGSIATILIVEPILGGLLPGVDRYLPVGAIGSILGLGESSHHLSAGPGVVVTLAYALGATALGALRTRTRDVN